jgi:hypothetical protein
MSCAQVKICCGAGKIGSAEKKRSEQKNRTEEQPTSAKATKVVGKDR